MVTRREQRGTAEHQLSEADAVPSATAGRRGKGKGKGKGNSEKTEKTEDDSQKPKRGKGLKRPAAAKAKVEKTSETKPAGNKKAKKADKDQETAGTDQAKEDKTVEKEGKKQEKKRRSKKDAEEVAKGDQKNVETKKTKSQGSKVEPPAASPPDDVPEPPAKVSRTWAGRWIPTDPFLLCKMNAIRQVYDSCVAKKIKSQSTFQNPFFVLCGKTFKSRGIDKPETTFEQFVAAAELEVEGFLKQESVSC